MITRAEHVIGWMRTLIVSVSDRCDAFQFTAHVNSTAHGPARHDDGRVDTSPRNCSSIASRARKIRERTVPTGHSITCAICS